MKASSRALTPAILLSAVLVGGSARADPTTSAFTFFVGVTESLSTLKVVMRQPAETRCIGRGEIEADGTLSLVQRVEDEGRLPYVRQWRIRQIGPGHYSGSMSEAAGPVTIDQVGSRYRFRFRIEGGMSVEQWLTPLPGGRSAATDMIVRKFGIAVASAKGVVRKVP